MPETRHRAPAPPTQDWQRRYQAQKRLVEALFGLLRTLGTSLSVEHVAKVALLTLTGQLLVKRAAFFERNANGEYSNLVTVGARGPQLDDLRLREDATMLAVLFRQGSSLAAEAVGCDSHPALASLAACGFETLVPILSEGEPLGMIALSHKVVPGPLSADDREFLDAFAVVIAVSLRNSRAYELMERSRNELRRLNDLKNEFLGHVSHEFRSPLTVLKSTLDLIDADAEIAAMQRTSLARLERLVSTVLLLNEINAGGVRLDLTVVHIPSWFELRIRPLLERHGHFAIRADLPECSMELDHSKLEAALDGIVDNAVKFATEAEHTQVDLYMSTLSHVAQSDLRGARNLGPGALRPQAPVDVSMPGTCLVIEVRDRGIGIPQEDLDRIFQPFTQAENSPTRGVRGAGLGLSMAKSVVEAHGGRILCCSAVKRGTNIYLIVPTRRPDA